jgi:hypothetical protein
VLMLLLFYRHTKTSIVLKNGRRVEIGASCPQLLGAVCAHPKVDNRCLSIITF